MTVSFLTEKYVICQTKTALGYKKALPSKVESLI